MLITVRKNHYCERLMLFFPWRNEETDLKGNCDSYQEKYMMHKDDIEKIRIHYEKFNEDLEEALENAASKEYEENISTSGEEVENNTFGCLILTVMKTLNNMILALI